VTTNQAKKTNWNISSA